MKKYKDLLGIALVIIGVLVLVISFLTGLDNLTSILFSGLILIGGIIMPYHDDETDQINYRHNLQSS